MGPFKLFGKKQGYFRSKGALRPFFSLRFLRAKKQREKEGCIEPINPKRPALPSLWAPLSFFFSFSGKQHPVFGNWVLTNLQKGAPFTRRLEQP